MFATALTSQIAAPAALRRSVRTPHRRRQMLAETVVKVHGNTRLDWGIGKKGEKSPHNGSVCGACVHRRERSS